MLRPAWLLWLFTLGAIPLLSCSGRPLQEWFLGHIGQNGVVLLLAVSLLGFGCLVVRYFVSNGEGIKPRYLLCSIPLLIVIALTTQSMVELSHIMVFGLFGFLTLRLFSLPLAIVLCLMVAGLDELLQYYLPSRVGDWQDVLLNLLSTGLGGMWAFFLHRDQQGRAG
ncbi:MAG: VanZ family protein [Thermodesulfobacteriota bacterium]